MFWDGTRWIDERAPATPPAPCRRRARDWIATGFMIIGIVALAIPFAAAVKWWPRLYSSTVTDRRRSLDVAPTLHREPGTAREIVRSPVVAAILMIAAAGLLGQPWLSAAPTPTPTAAPAPTPTPTAAPAPTPTPTRPPNALSASHPARRAEHPVRKPAP
jgi:hypothetical protein